MSLTRYALAALSLAACSSTGSSPPPTADVPAADNSAPLDQPVVSDQPAPPEQPAVDQPPSSDAPPSGEFTALPPLTAEPVRTFTAAPSMMLDATLDYRAVMETDAGRMVLDLTDQETPITVNSFVFLARNRFYDGLAFHRVISGFVAQGGDPNTATTNRSTWGRGGPGYFFGLEIQAALRFDAPGVLGMARSTAPNTNGSQFYITLAPTPSLNGMYTVFGRVTEGLDVLASITRGEPPATPTRITRVTIETRPR